GLALVGPGLQVLPVALPEVRGQGGGAGVEQAEVVQRAVVLVVLAGDAGGRRLDPQGDGLGDGHPRRAGFLGAQGEDGAEDAVVRGHGAERGLVLLRHRGLEAQAADAFGRAQLQAGGVGQPQPGRDAVRTLRLDEFIDEAADLARVARCLGHALFAVVQLLDDLHRQVDVVFLELEQRRRVVHQDIGVEHVHALAFGHHGWLVSYAWCRFTASITASAWPGTRTLRHSPAIRCSGSIRNLLRSMPITLRPYMFFSRITSNARHRASSPSLTRGNLNPCFAQKLSCERTESRETPSTSVFRRLSFGSRALNSRPWVVQPGVESFG